MSETSELTVEDLKKELPEQDYQTFTLGEDTVGTRCLLRAKMVTKGVILSTGHAYDETDDVCRMAVLARAVYELFSFCGQESRAKDKLSDWELFIKTNYGSIITKSDTDSTGETGPAVAVVQPPRTNPLDGRL